MVSAQPTAAEARVGMFGEIGSSRWGVGYDGTSTREGELPELQGDKAVRAFREMRLNDPIVGAVVMATKMIIRGVEWKSELPEGAEEDDAEALACQEFLQGAMLDMEDGWEEMIEDSLEACVYGFQPLEVVLKQRLGPQSEGGGLPHSEYDDGLIGWHKIAYRDCAGIQRWNVDNHGSILGYWHKAEGMDQEEVYIPMSKSILFRASRIGNDPQGLSWLRSAYRSYKHKRNMEWLEGVAADRGFAGFPVVEMPMGANNTSGSADLTAAQNMVRGIRQDSYMGAILPPPLGKDEHQKWKLRLEGGAHSVSDTIDNSIRRYASEISASVLAYFIILTMNSKGAYALSRDQRDLWHLAMSGLLDAWQQLINRKLVRKLFELNVSAFPDRTKWARIVPSDVAQHDIEKVVSFLTQLNAAGLLDANDDDRNRIRAQIGWPAETKEQVEKRHEQEAQMEEMNALAREAMINPPEAQETTSNGNSPPPPRPTQASELSPVEQLLGRPLAEWGPEDYWTAAMWAEDKRA